MSVVIIGPLMGSMNEGLIAQIFECNDTGGFIGDIIVAAPPIDTAAINLVLNWVSPFESVGTEAKAPALTALLQSGQAQSVVTAIDSLIPESLRSAIPTGVADVLKRGQDGLNEALVTLQGRSSMTKLNSRQVFSNMPPVKFPLTLYFRAWQNAYNEVERPIDQLMTWALSKKIADKSVLQGLADSKKITLEGLFPSLIPSFVGLRYGGKSYGPLVIESIDDPIICPRDSDLNRVSASVTINLATLAAIDREDWLLFGTDYSRDDILNRANKT